MNRFKNILLVCDEGSVHEELIGRAVWLAKANGATITVVDVIQAAPGELARLFSALPGVSAHDVEHEVVDFHRMRLVKLAAPIKSEGIVTSEIVLQGIPFVEIIRKVLRDKHDLVMKGAAGEAEGRSLFFASTDLHLMRKCPCPVWIMKRSRRRKYARILAAVDPDPTDARRDSLNRLIMDLATSLSRMEGSELHLTHVWNLEGEETLRHSGFAKIAESEVDILAAAQRRRCAPQLLLESLCTAPATRQPAAAQRRPRAPQLVLEALCTAPATRKAAAAQR